MKTRRTALIALCAAVLLPSVASAQYFDPDPFGYQEQRDRAQQRHDRYEQRQREILDDALRPFQRDPTADMLNRQAHDQRLGREACNAITNNPAARRFCLEGLR